MGFVGKTIVGIKKAIPVLAAKVATVLLFFVVVGLFAGFLLARLGYNEWVLVLPVIAMIVMWHKLDEGFLVLLLSIILILAFPEFFLR